MKKKPRIPVFALGESCDWEDLMNALEASVEYQTRVRQTFGPLFAFAPRREPENPDAWEPIDVTPDFLLLVSIERKVDMRMLELFRRVETMVGPLLLASPKSAVMVDDEGPLGDVIRQMEAASVVAFARLGFRADDVSTFFVRGAEAIRAVNAALAGA